MDYGILAAMLTIGAAWVLTHCVRNGCGEGRGE